MSFNCLRCFASFNHLFELLKHERIVHENRVHNHQLQPNALCFVCPLGCEACFGSLNETVGHCRSCKHQLTLPKPCLFCNKILKTKATLVKHTIKCLTHDTEQSGAAINRLPKLRDESLFKLSRRAFQNYLQQYELFPSDQLPPTNDATEFFNTYFNEIKELLDGLVAKIRTFKVQFCIACSFRKEGGEGQVSFTLGYFVSENIIFNEVSVLREIINRLAEEFDTKIHQFEGLGSGYVIEEIDRLDIRIGVYSPLIGGCHVTLPKVLSNKGAIVNIAIKDDNRCFLFAVAAALYTTGITSHQPQYYERFFTQFNTSGLEFPVKLSMITSFEKKNENLLIAINIFSYDQNDRKSTLIKPILISENYKARNQIDLLLIGEHFCWIRNFNRLIGSFANGKHHTCKSCFASFDRLKRLENHKLICQKFKPSIAILPDDKNKMLYFKKVENMKKFTFVAYADFECILRRKEESISEKVDVYQEHVPISYCLIVIKNDELIYEQKFYRGADVMMQFFNDLKEIENDIINQLKVKKDMIPLNDEQNRRHNQATECYLCGKSFLRNLSNNTIMTDDISRDHCHLTGEYLGAAHKACNLRYQIKYKVPLLIHNLKGYDSHFIISHLSDEIFKKCDIIPRNTEQILSFKLDHVQFLDSYQFMNESLAQIVKNLKDAQYKFPITCCYFKDLIGESQHRRNLLFRKSLFPYDWFDCSDKLLLTHLPPKDVFFSSLTQEHISDDDYSHAKEIWREFKCKTFAEYHDIYLKLDTTLLADCFQEFRRVIQKEYGLEPCHYYSIPGVAWDAALKITGVELELLIDVDQYNFITESIRGGYACVNLRQVRANNKYMKRYDSSKEDVYLCLLDCINLYGYALNGRLPKNGFRWLTESEYCGIDWSTIETDDTDIGYALEVDLDYPEELHDNHNDFPLALLKMKIETEQLSSYQKNLIDFLSERGYRRFPVEKLVATLLPKTKYILHFKNLKLYLNLKMELKSIHRVLQFKQSKYLEKYILMNAELRKNAINEFQRNLFKLMNNSVFGKSIQNQRTQVNIKLCLSEKQAKKYLVKPNYESFRILKNETVALIQLRKQKVHLCRPIFLGWACLELAKYHMYDTFYNHFKKYYGDKVRCCYGDTDSMLLAVKTKDFYRDLKTVFIDIMDLSNYPKTGRFKDFHDTRNEKVIGRFKDEFPGVAITEFIGIKPKLYSILYDDDDKYKTKAKGLQKSVLKKTINHENYRQCLIDQQLISSEMRRIRALNHELTTVKFYKQVFQPLCDKRWYKSDGLDSLAFGHKDIPNE